MKKTSLQKGYIVQGILAVVVLILITGSAYYASTKYMVIDDSGRVKPVSSPKVESSYKIDDQIIADDKPDVKPDVKSDKLSVTVLSPNGGEVWKKGSQQTITWKTGGDIPSNYQVFIAIDGNGYIGTKKVNVGNESYTFNVPKFTIIEGDMGVELKEGAHKVSVVLYDGDINLGNGVPGGQWGKPVASDESDSFFTIIN